MNALKKLFLFWKNPNENHHSLSKREIVLLFSVFFPISFAMNFVQNYFSYTYVYKEHFEWKYALVPTGISWASVQLILVYFFLGIIEEFAFRRWLKKKWLGKYLKLFTWISFIAFFTAHAQPWHLEVQYWVYIPLKTLAPLLGGLLLTFIRMQSSIKDAIIVHCLHNLIGILLAIGLGLLFIDEAMTDIKINI